MLVLGVLALLLFGVTRLVGGSGPDARPASAPVAAPSSALTPSTTQPPARVTSPASQAGQQTQGTSLIATPGGNGRHGTHRHHGATPTSTPLAVPTGPCANGDVLVTPAVRRAYAGQDVTITLDLTTKTSPACTWEVSPTTVVVQLTSGSDEVWSSQDCPGALGQHSVVVRKDQPTEVRLVWGGRRSDATCSRSTLWAQPGWYHVEAAAYGAGPTDEQFHLLQPPRPTVTRTPKPHQKPAGPTPAAGSTTSSTPSATASPAATPSASSTN